MRPRFTSVALVTVCALFAALIAAGPAAARTAPAPAARQPQPGGVVDPRPHPVLLAKSYTAPMIIVRHGDTLSQIARRACHRASFWPELWWANRKRVHNPNLITPGERLRVPSCRRARARIVTSALDAIPAPPPAPAPVAVAASAASPPQQPAAATAATYTGSSSMQQCIIAAESGGNSQVWNPTGHWGLYQFSASTWAAHGGNPADFGSASVAEQNQVYANTVAADGYSDWAPYDGC